MYSSGGDLHLELPTGQQGGTGKLWVRHPRPPHGILAALLHRYEPAAASCVCRRFLRSRQRGWWEPASRPGTWTTTRLSSGSKPTPPTRTSSSSSQWRWRSPRVGPPAQPLPPRIQDAPSVLSGWPSTPSSAAPGIYSSTEMLDFGTLRSQGTDSHLQQQKEAPVYLQILFVLRQSQIFAIFSRRSAQNVESTPFKFGNKRCPYYSRCLCRSPFSNKGPWIAMWWALCNLILSCTIQSVRTTPSNEAVTIDFRAVTLKAGDSRYTKVASISFDGELTWPRSQDVPALVNKIRNKKKRMRNTWSTLTLQKKHVCVFCSLTFAVVFKRLPSFPSCSHLLLRAVVQPWPPLLQEITLVPRLFARKAASREKQPLVLHAAFF